MDVGSYSRPVPVVLPTFLGFLGHRKCLSSSSLGFAKVPHPKNKSIIFQASKSPEKDESIRSKSKAGTLQKSRTRKKSRDEALELKALPLSKTRQESVTLLVYVCSDSSKKCSMLLKAAVLGRGLAMAANPVI